jgi:major vault protein
MAMSEQNPKRELILAPGEYAYMQDTTKGVIKTLTGPTVINQTAQERPIAYHEGSKTFVPCSLEQAMRKAPIAPEGFYIILLNSAKGGKHPDEGAAQSSAELDIGRKVNIPGPATFALWPGQSADVVRGHHLHNNQYLLVRVYNEEEAKKNWTSAVVKPATPPGEGEAAPSVTSAPPPDLTVGKQLIIRGTEVSFYIPPTGIGVVIDENGSYVREALTLERLEYCILVDEDGNKRYEKGPQVVFPLPSERFIEDRSDKNHSKKFRAIELNLIQGLHIKVIAPYEENGKKYAEGDELFITGKDTAIYYPREEHSAIKYDGKAKHFATAIPAGEARYLMNRLTGEIKTVKGPAMLLPDPRSEVIVRRVLSEKQASLWYPGNSEVAVYNRELRTIASNVPTTRQGAVSEGDFERNSRGVTRGGGGTKGIQAKTSGGLVDSPQYASASYNSMMESSRVSGDQALVGEEFSRASSYTSPRTVTLDTKYQGAPGIDIWTGYAVMVVSKTGHRHVEKGPKTVLLEYDEALEVLELSMGKPKTTDNTLKTVYLRVDNNKVSDIVEVETVDHVKIQLYLSYLVNFEGDANNWFSVENYIKFLCDHARSVLRGAVRKLKAEDFYTNAADIIRDTILGKSADGKRIGMLFKENGMRVGDVEVLRVHLLDERIRQLLDNSQHEVVRSNIDLSNLNRNLAFLKEKENLAREEAKILTETKLTKDKLQLEVATSSLSVILAQLENELSQFEAKRKIEEATRELMDENHGAQLDRMAAEKQLNLQVAKQESEIKIEALRAEAEATVQRFSAVKEGFAEALVALSNKDTLEKVAQAWSLNRVIGGDSISDALRRTFTGSPLEPFIEKVVNVASANGRSSSSLASPSLT